MNDKERKKGRKVGEIETGKKRRKRENKGGRNIEKQRQKG